jgi:hypothetical protein
MLADGVDVFVGVLVPVCVGVLTGVSVLVGVVVGVWVGVLVGMSVRVGVGVDVATGVLVLVAGSEVGMNVGVLVAAIPSLPKMIGK